jgi:DNA-directed RNA polymerase specialized sigma24 family protein
MTPTRRASEGIPRLRVGLVCLSVQHGPSTSSQCFTRRVYRLIAGKCRLDNNWAMSDVTRILSQIESGDPAAASQLLPLVYDELRKMAAAKLAQEKPGQTLQATALVHEAYLRLVGPAGPAGQDPGASGQEPGDSDLAPGSRPLAPGSFSSRGHFFGAAAEAMRRILVENARSRGRLKRGGQRQRVDLDSSCQMQPPPSLDILALDEALAKLALAEPVKAELVKLRYFAGLTMPQAAAALGVSLATAERYWTFARSWLYSELADQPTADP